MTKEIIKQEKRKYKRALKNKELYKKGRIELIDAIIGSAVPNFNIKVTPFKHLS